MIHEEASALTYSLFDLTEKDNVPTIRAFKMRGNGVVVSDELSIALSVPSDDRQFVSWAEGSCLVSLDSSYHCYLLFGDEPLWTGPVVDLYYMARHLHPAKEPFDLAVASRKLRVPPQEDKLLWMKDLLPHILREFERRGKKLLGEILPLSRPKPVTRAYRVTHQVLHDSFLRRRPVEIVYAKRPEHQRRHEDTRESEAAGDPRIIEIYGFRSPFVVAYCRLRRDLRLFRLDRIDTIARVLPETYAVPEDFSLGGFLMGNRVGLDQAT
jgi:hypothetical protein